MKLLLTAFEPFGGEATNAAWEASKRLPERIGEIEICKMMVPTAFFRCEKPVLEAISREKPDFVLMLGQAAGRSALTPERVAVNVMDARIADNDGKKPVDRPIAEDGPAAYVSTLPIKRMTEAIQNAGIPAAVSNSAGTFVCNCLFYSVLHHLAEAQSTVKAGFLHVPVTPAQALEKQLPSMPLEEIVRGLCAAIRSLI